MCSVLIGVGDKATFDVVYSPTQAVRSLGTIQLSVEDNQYEDQLAQVSAT